MKIKLPAALETSDDDGDDGGKGDSISGSSSSINSIIGDVNNQPKSLTGNQANHGGKLNGIGLASVVFYIIVIMFIGLPIWFKTTSPSRYTLPHISSLMVHSQTTINQIEIDVVIAVDLDRDSLRAQLPKGHISSDGSMAFNIDWKVRKMTPKEEDVWAKSKSIDIFDSELANSDSHRVPGSLFIFLVDMGLVKKFGRSATVLGSNRFIYIGIRDEEMSVLDESEDKSVIVLIMEILESVLEVKNDQPITSLSIGQETGEEKESIKSLLNREVDVIVNYITEDIEDAAKLQTTQAIEKARKLGEEGFIRSSGISRILHINLMSEMVYYGLAPDFIETNLINSNDPTRKQRLFNIANVGLLLNSIESRLVEPNTKLNYHLHVIIPSRRKNQSTFFYDKQTNSQSFAISTSFRAGVFFWNREEDFNLAFKSFMRNLMGLPSIQPYNCLRRNIFFTQWELDYLMRTMTLQHLAKTLSSLESLDKLLLKVKNIVILQDIAQKMNLAADLSHQAIDLLAKGDLLKANELSSKAFQASESAFFDPSLLSRLYFPEDQKYAVYFPLFLPVSVPLLLSFGHLTRLYYRKLTKKSHEKQD